MPLMHPQFDPVAISVGPIAIHWYGLMYLMAFAQFLLLGKLRVKSAQYQAQQLTYKYIEDLLFAGVLGVILGGEIFSGRRLCLARGLFQESDRLRRSQQQYRL